MEIIRSERGQAAVMDALYFLLIVSGLSTLLFLFIVDYGSSVDFQWNRFVRSEYASSSLKTIFYSSVPRNFDVPVEELEDLSQATEIDYLMTVLKEDYADDGIVNESKFVLANEIEAIMEPFSANFDYMFYIYAPTGNEFIYMLLHKSNLELGERRGNVQEASDDILFCTPSDLEKLDSLLEALGPMAQANTTMRMDELELVSRDPNEFYVHINLTMWNPTSLEDDLINTRLNCELFLTKEPIVP